MPEPGREAAEGVHQQHPYGEDRTVKEHGLVASDLAPKMGAEKPGQIVPGLHLRVANDLGKVVAHKPAPEGTRVDEERESTNGEWHTDGAQALGPAWRRALRLFGFAGLFHFHVHDNQFMPISPFQSVDASQKSKTGLSEGLKPLWGETVGLMNRFGLSR